MMDLAGPVAVVAHDAGAANIILAWLDEAEARKVRPAMAGPAARLWEARFPAVSLLKPADALDGAATLLSGTGWASSLEYDARRAARDAGIRSVAVIDHWVNYRARFLRDGEELLPDAIWVTDAYALAEARRTLPEVPVEQHPNLYVAQQAAAAGPRPQAGDLLFVCEPARSDWGQGVPGEFQTLDYLAANRAAAGISTDAKLRIRPHPSDLPGKYDAWIAAHPGSTLDASADMAAALQGAAWVAGLQSFALAIALEAGRPAICALPPAAPPCALPHADIVHLRRMMP